MKSIFLPVDSSAALLGGLCRQEQSVIVYPVPVNYRAPFKQRVVLNYILPGNLYVIRGKNPIACTK